jgi:hypothetical protein
MRSRNEIWAATRFWEMWGEVLLVFWYVQGSIYTIWKFKMKGWQLINFTTCTKDQRLMQKSNLQNYHIWLITPVVRLHDCCDVSESPNRCQAKVKCWCGLANWYPDVLGDCLLLWTQFSHTKHMTESHDHMIKAQHMALCDLAPFLFHMEDPEPQSTQHDLMLWNPHQSRSSMRFFLSSLSANRISSTYQIGPYPLSCTSIIDTMWYRAS